MEKTNKEEIKRYYKQYYKDNKEKIDRRTTKWYKNNVEKAREYMKQYCKNHREEKKKYDKEHKEELKEYRTQYYIKKLYGLSHEGWLKLYKNQDGRCAICKKLFEKPSDACVDHNHKTDEVRGLLCKNCNFGLGYFNDDLEIVKEAINYTSHFNLR